MSECVVRMEMPTSCEECPLVQTYENDWGDVMSRTCSLIYKGYLSDVPKGERRADCPIICSLPKGHGRLVDADALINQWETVPDKLAAGAGENKWVADMVMGIQGHFLEGIIKSLEDAPTIVPAEAERSKEK